MKKFIHFGHTPPGHHVGTLIETKGPFLHAVLFGLQLILAGLFMPLANLLKIPISLHVKPIQDLTWPEKKKILTDLDPWDENK